MIHVPQKDQDEEYIYDFDMYNVVEFVVFVIKPIVSPTGH